MTTAISLQHVYKQFNDRLVINDLSFEVQKGECLGLLGPNGAGKSTTIKLILGHFHIDRGTIHALGKSVDTHAEDIRQQVGVVAQFDSLDPDFTVEENLWVYARYFGIGRKPLESRISDLLQFAMLENRRHDPINTLSGGMKRRLSIARSLVHQPSIILLDEPTTGLDPQARHLLWDRLKELKRQGLTILLTTHFMEEAERLCDRVAIMDDGKIKALGTPRALIQETINADVIEIYGDELTLFKAEIDAMVSSPHDLNSANRMFIKHVEYAGETIFCYVTQPQTLIDRVQQYASLRYLHRPANLEDVFLRLTGRDLRDD